MLSLMLKNEVGRVIKVQDGIIRINGMQNVIANEML
jgi:F0F1-type ATP synthase alpha subunit